MKDHENLKILKISLTIIFRKNLEKQEDAKKEKQKKTKKLKTLKKSKIKASTKHVEKAISQGPDEKPEIKK